MLIIMLMTAVTTRVAVIMTEFFPKALVWQILSVAFMIGIIFEVFN
jgi:hypothetical protein